LVGGHYSSAGACIVVRQFYQPNPKPQHTPPQVPKRNGGIPNGVVWLLCANARLVAHALCYLGITPISVLFQLPALVQVQLFPRGYTLDAAYCYCRQPVWVVIKYNLLTIKL
jgi:hypothetical protein